MKPALSAFVLRRVGKGFWRSRRHHLLCVTVMAASLFFFGAGTLAQINLERLLEGWGGQLQITAYFQRQLAASEISAALDHLQSWPEVEPVRLINQEQAWRDFQAALATQSGLLEGLSADVLPASVEIALKPAYRDSASFEQVAARLRGEKAFATIDYPQQWIERLDRMQLGLGWAKWSFGAVLFVAIFLVVSGAIKLGLTAHQEEIEVMQLLGAPTELIQAPFVLEGLIQGLAGAALSLALLWALFVPLQNEFSTFAALMAPLAEPRFLDSSSSALVLAMGSLLGAAASLFSLKKWLRGWKPAVPGV
jgi:cell division transport system permease protein